MMTDEDINLSEDQLLDNLDDTNGDVDLEVWLNKYTFSRIVFCI